MELGKSEVGETGGESFELDFDPDKLIDGNADKLGATEGDDAPGIPDVPIIDVIPDSLLNGIESFYDDSETVLHNPEQLAQPVEGLDQTQQDYEQLENGNTVYDHPQETGETLNSNQGKAVPGFVGTCGLVSAENVARMAGKDVSEADTVGIACENKDCQHHFWWPAEANGGTKPQNICSVLGHLGIDATADYEPSVNEMADAVESGHGVIAFVDVFEFWPDNEQEGGHAVTVTSVERDPDGNIAAFYVCDSGTGGEDACRRVDVDLFDASLNYSVTTNDIIR